MTVKLEMAFEDLAELKSFLDSKVEAPKTCTCQTPSAPEIVAQPQVVTPPPQEVSVESPAEPVITTTQPEPTEEAVPTPVVSTAANTYTLDDLARAGSELVDLGKQAELPGLLQRFNITSLPELPQDKYGEFATAMRELGARI